MGRKKSNQKISISRSTSTTYAKPKLSRQTANKFKGAMGTVSDGVNQDTGGWLNGKILLLEENQDYELIVSTESENNIGLDVYVGPGTINGTKIGTIGTGTGKKDEVVNFNMGSGTPLSTSYLGFSDENYGGGGEYSLTVIDQVSLVKKSTGGAGTCSAGAHADRATCEGAGETWTLDVPTDTDLITDGKFDWTYEYETPGFGSLKCLTSEEECTRLQNLAIAGTPGELDLFLWDRISITGRLDTRSDYVASSSCVIDPQFWQASGRFRYLNENIIPDTIDKIYMTAKDAEVYNYKNNACTPFHADADANNPCHGILDYWQYNSSIDTSIMGVTNTLNTSTPVVTLKDVPVSYKGRITVSGPTKIRVVADLSGFNPYTTYTYGAYGSAFPSLTFTSKDGYITAGTELYLTSLNSLHYVKSILANGRWNSTDLGAGRFRIESVDPLNIGKTQGEDWYNSKYEGDTAEERNPSYWNNIHCDLQASQLVTNDCDGQTGILGAGSYVTWEFLGDISLNSGVLGYLNLTEAGTYVIESEFRQHVAKGGQGMECYTHPLLNQKICYYSSRATMSTIPIKFEIV